MDYGNVKTTQMCTELITNNAAAALATPIAFSISRELDVSCPTRLVGSGAAYRCDGYRMRVGFDTMSIKKCCI